MYVFSRYTLLQTRIFELSRFKIKTEIYLPTSLERIHE